MSKLAELLRCGSVPPATPATPATKPDQSSKSSDCSSGSSIEAHASEGAHEAFEERAAILEFEAGLPRQEAEQRTALRERSNLVDLERRRARVVLQMQEHAELRVAFDVRNAPLKLGSGEPVSVVIAVRSEDNGIVSAEFSVPRDRFDFALFSKMLDETSRRPS